ncbi:two-component system, CitB family, sensor histidine kinase MalK [Halobacillus karajensis]|uniref:histidine kinase n=1 Tax=Halobacillus karajensis TaxID=195088 RepID=A0A024P7M7_9BACI|nr:DcuS/MalK family sensor histidine kinase [Halobacillus karajensis]CDQ20208.1 Sensor histidine kinase DcuS [Halobacillus karajensis]CDQ25129.1 Sensor histidine kinase DcuS [Halobacillus karajensis]CDQ28510.1 Sensor histidine kinase DcuS [Halobacillus karajensis]SEI01971.1 two-component system, CitB family, sensor histidine kinase MalK [Halobacillus karajensis]
MNKMRFKLSTMIIFYVLLVVLFSLLITDLLITENTSDNIREQLEEKALIVSRTVAESQVVQEKLQNSSEDPAIQDYAMSIQEASDVLFVVIMNMEGIRQSHPNPDLIGKPFMGGDETRVLNGEEYISISEGTLGHSVRAFTPIMADNGEQVGAVSIGISLDALEASLQSSHRNILIGSFIGALVGVIGAYLLARYIKKSLFGLEPVAIARIHEERNRMLHSVREGIIAVDAEAKITLVNKSARNIFKKAGLQDEDPVGLSISEYLPHSMLERVLKTGEAETDEEQVINGSSIIVNRVPLVVHDEVVGAISTFRDKTEVNQLAEQLTGVRLYAESLRAQSHEFKNKLHVLLGLAEMDSFEEVKAYIKRLVDHQIHEADILTNKIKDPVLAGFMLGKLSYAREQNIRLSVKCETVIPASSDESVTHELVTIIGNLIDNAIESLEGRGEKHISLRLSYVDELLEIEVSDTGIGIKEEKQQEIFRKGISTKGTDRGYGLYLVHTSIESLGGSLEIESTVNKGTTCSLIIPYEAEVEEA